MTSPPVAGVPLTLEGPRGQGRASTLLARSAKLDACVHCGFCLPACPTYLRLGDEADSPRGRLHIMRAVVEGRLDPGAEAFQRHIDRCLGCRACETACPSGVEYGALLEGAREAARTAAPPPWTTRLLLSVFRHGALTRAALAAGRLFRATGLPRQVARALPHGKVRLGLAMLAGSAPVRLAEQRFERSELAPIGGGQAVRPITWAESDPARPTTRAVELPKPPDRGGEPHAYAGILRGCVQAGLFARVNHATQRVLEANRVRVVPVRGQSCCGALHSHSGDLASARVLARRNIEAFERSGVEHVVVNAAGCGAAMKEYPHLLEQDPELHARAQAFAARVRDVSEVLADLGPRSGGTVEVDVAYDAPCHLQHAQGVVEDPLTMLRAVPGLRVRALATSDQCCGGAGIYGITHPDLGGRIGNEKVDDVVAAGAPLLTTANPGCMMQIGAGLLLRDSSVGVVHPVEILDESYRRAGLYRS